MITIDQVPKPVGFMDYKQEKALDLRGLSTDTKPTGAPNGSTFMEIDTGDVYCYDAENNVWYLW